MVDRSQIKKMWVWDGDGPNPKDTKRYVVYKDNSYYYAVAECNEEEFEAQGEIITIVSYDHAEEIKEEWRPFKSDEMPVEYVNYLYKDKHGEEDWIQKPTAISRQTAQLALDDTDWTAEELFNAKLVSKDGGKTWEPVGVKEE